MSPSTSGDPLSFLRVRELTWHDLVLPRDVLDGLRRLSAQAADGGLVAVVSGPPGVGKTVAVRACAEQLRLDTWRVDCALLVERHGEATAAVLPEVLAVGERPHAVLLFHDAEWLAEPGAGGAADRLLDLARKRRPPTVLETREPGLLRAGGVAEVPHVELPFPDEVARAELWRRLAWQAHPLLDLDVEALARVAAPGAAIERALGLALDRSPGELPTTADLLRVLGEAEPGRPPLP